MKLYALSGADTFEERPNGSTVLYMHPENGIHIMQGRMPNDVLVVGAGAATLCWRVFTAYVRPVHV